ncbi:MAG: 3-phosphoshikimate 1-carboxyvinyltransferase [Candidatus Eisenbacteria bacterium]|nr:3-phosphoshikimate 1-carboxyvinyltransferase [Candidatus Eisenbacteria bacterium]
MATADPVTLVVRPGRPLGGAFTPPGDKSITHRAFLLGLLAEGETSVEAANPGADGAATLSCAAALGARVQSRDGVIRIAGRGGALVEPDRVLDCGNSGTTLRLLAGVLASQPFLAVLSGDASLNARPVARVIEPLRRMGASLHARDGDRLPPLVVRGAALTGVEFDAPTASAQVASSILLAGLGARGVTSVGTTAGVRDHTPRMLERFGLPIRAQGGDGGVTRWTVEGPVVPRAARVRIPGDFSAAAFFLAAAAATPGARVTARGVSLNPTRTGLLATLEAMGAMVETRAIAASPADGTGGEPVGEITVTGPDRLEATTIAPDRVAAMIDEIPAWAIAASAARGVSRLTGAGELRIKESDRIAALAVNLERLGIAVEELPDGLAITGGRVAGGTVDAALDHRIAMAFAVLATRASGPVVIHGAGGIATSYPGFADALAALGGDVTSGDAAVAARG